MIMNYLHCFGEKEAAGYRVMDEEKCIGNDHPEGSFSYSSGILTFSPWTIRTLRGGW
jgi:hypothetical protein